jgi:hypothetical protein
VQISALINKQKEFLSYELEGGFRQLSQQCAHTMVSARSFNDLDDLLHSHMKKCKYANLTYVLDCSGVQFSSNVDRTQILTDFQGQDLSARPFFNKVDVEHPFYLSDAYISGATLKPCISAVHAICYDDVLIGMLVFDLELQKLPLLEPKIGSNDFRQIKGDPEIRSNLFNQNRVQSEIGRAHV